MLATSCEALALLSVTGATVSVTGASGDTALLSEPTFMDTGAPTLAMEGSLLRDKVVSTELAVTWFKGFSTVLATA